MKERMTDTPEEQTRHSSMHGTAGKVGRVVGAGAAVVGGAMLGADNAEAAQIENVPGSPVDKALADAGVTFTDQVEQQNPPTEEPPGVALEPTSTPGSTEVAVLSEAEDLANREYELTPQDITEDNRMFGYDRGQGRTLIPFGISPDIISGAFDYPGVDRMMLSGILMETPQFNAETGDISFIIGIPSTTDNRFNVVEIKLETIIDRDGNNRSPIRYVQESMAGGFTIEVEGTSSTALIEDVMPYYEEAVGDQVIFGVSMASDPSRIIDYLSETYGEDRIQGTRLKGIVDDLSHTNQVLWDILNGGSFNGASIRPLTYNHYFPGTPPARN